MRESKWKFGSLDTKTILLVCLYCHSQVQWKLLNDYREEIAEYITSIYNFIKKVSYILVINS